MTCEGFREWLERFLSEQRGLDVLPAARDHARTCGRCSRQLERRVRVGSWDLERREFWRRLAAKSHGGSVARGGALPGRIRAAAAVLGGETLVSVFMARTSDGARLPRGIRLARGGRDYVVRAGKGYQAVVWKNGPLVMGVVARLGYRQLLDCADRLRGSLEASRNVGWVAGMAPSSSSSDQRTSGRPPMCCGPSTTGPEGATAS